MDSLPLAFGAGVGLGIMEQVVRWNSADSPSVIYVVYLVVIVGALLLQRGKLSRAQEGGTSSWSAAGVAKPIPEELRWLPEVRWAKVGVLTLVGLAFVFLPKGWSATNQLLAGFAIVLGDDRRVARDPHRVGRQHQPRPVRHRRASPAWSPATSSPTTTPTSSR